jgi:hypothetical protein
MSTKSRELYVDQAFGGACWKETAVCGVTPAQIRVGVRMPNKNFMKAQANPMTASRLFGSGGLQTSTVLPSSLPVEVTGG